MLVRHSMVRRPRSVAPEASCQNTLQMFQEHCIRHAPVMSEGRLVGVVSERDLLRALPWLIGDMESSEGDTGTGPTVSMVMASEPVTCGLNDPVDVVAKEMESQRIGCMPVVDRDQVVGLVTTTDLLRGFTNHLDDEAGYAITLVWAHGDRQVCPDVPELCIEHGLRLTAFLETKAESGGRVFLIRPHGDDTQLAAFIADCEKAQLGVLTTGENVRRAG